MLLRLVFAFLCSQLASSLQKKNGKMSTSELKGQALHSHKNILLIGSSVDRWALNFYCDKVNGVRYRDTRFLETLDSGMQFAQGCSTENFTLAFMFIPGSGPPPYFWCEYKPTLCGDNSLLFSNMTHATSNEIVELDAPDFAARSFKGSSPEIVVVEASNWDLATWHVNDGLGNSVDWPPSVLEKHVKQWSDHDVPALLDLAQRAFPESKILTHTPARPYKDCDSGQSVKAFDMLTSSLLSKADANGLLYGKYAFIDYHKVTADILLAKEAAGIDPFKGQNTYNDQKHPGREPAWKYIDQLLEIA
eukprot:TRINITY_DN1020_c0_g4_i1.p1 TRINITY_DN1020_c0_g4~~TRINITY_DN1020_c0_g4_i1.p1  ORF type:complete len:337 (-),score=38.92 TRINITY_DN1020_c0_g4_i1:51-965(-)